MKIKKNDIVKIITGKDKGKTGKVLKVLPIDHTIVVEGVNVVKKHIKPGTVGNNKEGGIVSIEKPIHVSNVLYCGSDESEVTRIGYKLIDNKKYRISKSTGDVIEK